MLVVEFDYRELHYPHQVMIKDKNDFIEFLKFHNLENYERLLREGISSLSSIEKETTLRHIYNLAEHGCITPRVPMAACGLGMLASEAHLMGLEKLPSFRKTKVSVERIIGEAMGYAKDVIDSKSNIIKRALNNKDLVFINYNQGYFHTSPDNVTNLKVLGEVEMTEFIGSKKFKIKTPAECTVAIVQERSGKVHVSADYQLHLDICDNQNIKEDECNKYRFDKNGTKELFGIKGLYLSNKFKVKDLVFTPNKSHLDILEKELEKLKCQK